VYLIGNTSWGYCFSPMPFKSESKAKEYGREMKEMDIGLNIEL
jgi:hypothetical protein